MVNICQVNTTFAFFTDCSTLRFSNTFFFSLFSIQIFLKNLFLQPPKRPRILRQRLRSKSSKLSTFQPKRPSCYQRKMSDFIQPRHSQQQQTVKNHDQKMLTIIQSNDQQHRSFTTKLVFDVKCFMHSI